MAIVRVTLEEIRANPPQLTAEQRARLDAMTDEELARGVMGRTVRLARQKTGLTQEKFAERFHINPARLRDWEQGRHLPDSVARAYLKVILVDPEAVERALAA